MDPRQYQGHRDGLQQHAGQKAGHHSRGLQGPDRRGFNRHCVAGQDPEKIQGAWRQARLFRAELKHHAHLRAHDPEQVFHHHDQAEVREGVRGIKAIRLQKKENSLRILFFLYL